MTHRSIQILLPSFITIRFICVCIVKGQASRSGSLLHWLLTFSAGHLLLCADHHSWTPVVQVIDRDNGYRPLTNGFTVIERTIIEMTIKLATAKYRQD
jgi:hypothetical protein